MCIRDSPPTFGASIVANVFQDESFTNEWKQELESMRVRIRSMREKFVQHISASMGNNRFDHILHQRGMFSYTGITPDVVEILKTDYSVFLLKSGRINVAGMNDQNIPRICDSIAAATKKGVAGE